MNERAPQNQDKYVLRLPDGMRDRIKAAAEANNRSMNAEIVATLEEKYPAPVRWFNVSKYKAHQEYVEKRSSELLQEVRALTAEYSNPQADIGALSAAIKALLSEHEALFDYDIEDERFHDIEYPSSG